MLNYAAHGNAGSVKYQTSASLFILYRPYKGHFKFRSNPTVTTILPFSEGTWNGLFHDPLANFQKYPYTCISFFLFLKHINYFVLVFYWRRVFSGDFLVPLKKTQKWIIYQNKLKYFFNSFGDLFLWLYSFLHLKSSIYHWKNL